MKKSVVVGLLSSVFLLSACREDETYDSVPFYKYDLSTSWKIMSITKDGVDIGNGSLYNLCANGKDIQSNNFVVRSHAERNAVNAPIQGSAADIIKIAMIEISKKLKEQNRATKMLLQVHDELIFEAPIEEVEAVTTLITSCMENAVKTTVPLLVEVGVGDHWLEAH